MVQNSQTDPHILPGFKMTLGFTLFYVALMIVFPLSMLFFKSSQLSWAVFYKTITHPNTLAAYKLSFGTSFIAALINAVFGFCIAWVLARYRFPGKRFLDVLIDIPFALPTAIAGLALATLHSKNGWVGKLLEPLGIQSAGTRIGITVALIFIGLPFVVRTVQPVLKDLDRDMEEAAACLGAGRLRTFLHVIFPAVFPALVTGFTLAFARALGEYGSVVFIASNIPGKTEIAPQLIMAKLGEHAYEQATAIAAVMLIVSLLILILIYYFSRRWMSKNEVF